MTDRKSRENDTVPVMPEGLGREATQLLKHFWALTPKNQTLAVKLLQALLRTQGTAV